MERQAFSSTVITWASNVSIAKIQKMSAFFFEAVQLLSTHQPPGLYGKAACVRGCQIIPTSFIQYIHSILPHVRISMSKVLSPTFLGSRPPSSVAMREKNIYSLKCEKRT